MYALHTDAQAPINTCCGLAFFYTRVRPCCMLCIQMKKGCIEDTDGLSQTTKSINKNPHQAET